MNLTVTDDIEDRYFKARAALIEYLRHKIDVADWHGVSDAANDLRVLEAQHSAQFHHEAP